MNLTSSNRSSCLLKPWRWLNGVCCKSDASSNPYLREFELQRVLALIGNLATYDSAGGNTSESTDDEITIPGADRSDAKANWLHVAKSHPEFFFVRISTSKGGSEKECMRLWARFQQPLKPGEPNRPPLDPDRIIQLQTMAATLHDAAVRLANNRDGRRTVWIQAGVTVVAALLGIIASLVTSRLTGI